MGGEDADAVSGRDFVAPADFWVDADVELQGLKPLPPSGFRP